MRIGFAKRTMLGTKWCSRVKFSIFLSKFIFNLNDVRGRVLGRCPLPSTHEVFAEVCCEEKGRWVMLKEETCDIGGLTLMRIGGHDFVVPRTINLIMGQPMKIWPVGLWKVLDLNWVVGLHVDVKILDFNWAISPHLGLKLVLIRINKKKALDVNIVVRMDTRYLLRNTQKTCRLKTETV